MIKSYRRPANPGINFAGMPAAMRRREEEKAAKNAPKIEVKKKTARSPKTKKKN